MIEFGSSKGNLTFAYDTTVFTYRLMSNLQYDYSGHSGYKGLEGIMHKVVCFSSDILEVLAFRANGFAPPVRG